MNARNLLVAVPVLLVGCTAPVDSDPIAEAGPPPIVYLGGVAVDAAQQSISISGRVNQVEGPIEFLVCGPRGKTHESILVVDEPPANVHAAVLLLGIEPGNGPVDLGVGPLDGPRFDIWLEWGGTEAPSRVRAESMIYNYRTKENLEGVSWIFSGSEVIEGRFKADAYGSFVATYWDPWALFNIDSDVGMDDEALLIQAAAVPPEGEPVRIEFRLRD